jgi:hypothetical protein
MLLVVRDRFGVAVNIRNFQSLGFDSLYRSFLKPPLLIKLIPEYLILFLPPTVFQLQKRVLHLIFFLFHRLFNSQAIDIEEGTDLVDYEERPAKVMHNRENKVRPEKSPFRFHVVERQAILSADEGKRGGILHSNEGEIDDDCKGEEG